MLGVVVLLRNEIVANKGSSFWHSVVDEYLLVLCCHQDLADLVQTANSAVGNGAPDL